MRRFVRSPLGALGRGDLPTSGYELSVRPSEISGPQVVGGPPRKVTSWLRECAPFAFEGGVIRPSECEGRTLLDYR
jgi:hypothetical protein